ncbi:MAG TPA: prolipoprotein diacylglyceryl transferase family protein [Phycisphaerae bacterium]|nr:prolipoprotein diacylglyceryl transferase family protein [Phycisphaerae bacterium]
MHPQLWTVPGIGYTVHAWGFMVFLGFWIAVWVAVLQARRAAASPAVVTTIALIGAVAGLVGCRAMYLLHYYREPIRSGGMDFQDVAAMRGGGEILGGVLLATLAVIVYLVAARRSIRLYLDVVLPSVILAMGIGRIGCLLAGCCWGETCLVDAGRKALPWAVRFPYGAPAYERHWQDGQLTVPDELLWALPGNAERTPIPAAILADPAIDGNRQLAEYVEHVQALSALKDAPPQSPEVARHRDRLSALQPVLPGGSKEETTAYVAAAAHLRRLSQQRDRPVTIADLRAIAATQHSQWVHPAQIYDAIGLALLFFVLSAVLRRRRRHGMVVAWTMMLYPVSRFLQEMLRGDNPHDVAGLTVSQSLSAVLFALGLIYLLILIRFLPERSPRAADAPQRSTDQAPSPA